MQKFLKLLFYAILAILTIISFAMFFSSYNELGKKEGRTSDLENRLAEKKNECLELRQLFHDLENNPKAVEKVAREKFGLCGPDEIIYIYKVKVPSFPEIDQKKNADKTNNLMKRQK